MLLRWVANHTHAVKTIGLCCSCRHYASSANKRVKQANRREYLYGVQSCHAALQSPLRRREIFHLYLDENLDESHEQSAGDFKLLRDTIETAKSRDIPVSYKSTAQLRKFTSPNRDWHENIVLEAGRLNYLQFENPPVPMKGEKIMLALDRVQDPINLGGIIKSCAYYGVNRIVVGRKECAPLSALASYTSEGKVESFAAYSVPSLVKFLEQAKVDGWNTIGTTTAPHNKGGDEVLFAHGLSIDTPTIIAVGSEGFGLSPRVLDACSQLVTVNSFNTCMPKGLDSLNVSVATGIILHMATSNDNRKKVETVAGATESNGIV